MYRFLLCGAVIAVLITPMIGCGPRAELAKDKVIAQIDKVLGELDVKRKKIEVNQRKLQQEMATLREKRIGTEVRLEQLNKKKSNSEAEVSSIEGKLVKLRDLIAEVKNSEGTIERNGKQYTADDLQAAATELAGKFKSAKNAANSVQTSIDALTRSVGFLKSQEKTAKEMMAKLNTKIEEIDSKKVAIDAVRHASSVAGEDSSIMDRINSLDKEIEDMFVEVETAMRVEEAKLTEVNSQTSSADELLAEPVDLNSTMAEIDALLGSGGGDGSSDDQ